AAPFRSGACTWLVESSRSTSSPVRGSPFTRATTSLPRGLVSSLGQALRPPIRARHRGRMEGSDRGDITCCSLSVGGGGGNLRPGRLPGRSAGSVDFHPFRGPDDRIAWRPWIAPVGRATRCGPGRRVLDGASGGPVGPAVGRAPGGRDLLGNGSGELRRAEGHPR